MTTFTVEPAQIALIRFVFAEKSQTVAAPDVSCTSGCYETNNIGFEAAYQKDAAKMGRTGLEPKMLLGLAVACADRSCRSHKIEICEI